VSPRAKIPYPHDHQKGLPQHLQDLSDPYAQDPDEGLHSITSALDDLWGFDPEEDD
jgi:hypothetical protein